MTDRSDVIRFSGSRLTASDIDVLARSRPRGSLEIALGSLEDADFGAEARLLGWLARHLYGDVVLHLEERVTPDGTMSARMTHVLHASLVGFVTSRMAHRILDSAGTDVTALVRDRQRASIAPDRSIGDHNNFSYLIDDGLAGLGAAELIDAKRPGFSIELAQTLGKELERRGLSRGLRSNPNPADIAHVRMFLTEALENTEIHATRFLDGRAVGGVRFLNIRRRFLDEASTISTTRIGRRSEEAAYLNQLRDAFGPRLPVVAFTIADSGIGIPAHVRQDMSVYSGPLSDEVALLRSAFSVPSAKRKGWHGYGLPKVQLAARDLSAFLSIRTGRTLATQAHFDATRGLALTDDPIDLASFELVVDEQEHPVLAGTSITLIVPWRSPDETLI